ncbi:hypothetical protein SLS62_004209 [Diatrype stigma]|uniref:Uncharacterized protein n=1 Tax=Diatrype stigma TaxID=117547 RepID=A0AAN9YPF0_9PEZI
MQERKKSKNATENEDALVKQIEQAAIKAFVPDEDVPSMPRSEFEHLISSTPVFPLMKALNALIKPGRVPDGIRPHLMKVLTELPQRPGGVEASLEFVFSVHPSSTVMPSEAAVPQRRGGNITMESLKMATNILSIPPVDVDAREWYQSIAPQLFALLDGKDPDLIKAAAYVIGFGILGRRKFGSRGSAGWNIFARSILIQINPSMDAHLQSNPREPIWPLTSSGSTDESISIVRSAVLVGPDELASALRCLSSLLNSHPNPGLTARLLHPILPHLWALSSWPDQDEDIASRYSNPARNLLKTLLKLSKDVEDLRQLVDNLLYRGESNEAVFQWEYERVAGGGIRVRWLQAGHHAEQRGLDIGELESKVNAFVQLLQSLKSDSEISAMFLILLQDSLAKREGSHQIKIQVYEEQPSDPTSALIKAKVLQKMMEVMPNRLVSDPKNLLDLASGMLSRFESAMESDDLTAVALSLLNLVVTAPEFKKSNIDSAVLASIESSLNTISKAQDPDVSQTAHNISLLLTYRDAMDDPSEQISAPTDQQVEDRKSYQLAMQYITDPDSLPPVRSEGLNLLSSLIQANSPILDIPTVLALLSSLLGDDEDYTYLRVIKLFTQLATRHPRSVTKELLEHYVDSHERANTDTRLRFGEALTQVIQRLGETFTAETAALIAEALLATAGRRGRRPKTERRQALQARAQARKHKEASDAWGGEVPDLGDDDTDDDDDDKAKKKEKEEKRVREEAIAQIVGGWESKRGHEDLRIRASALAAVATALETNIAGLGAALAEAAVALSLDILTLERGPEAGILRRAAVIVIYRFVRALADAREAGRELEVGFGLTDASRADMARVLKYVAQTDNDGLVQSNASEVVACLDSWALTTALMPEARRGVHGGSAGTLSQLAGLNISAPNLSPTLRFQQEGPSPGLNSGLGLGSMAKGRPRIEEVE